MLVARSEPQQDEDEEDERPQRPAAKKSENRQLPSIVARAEASKGRHAPSPSFGVSVDNNRRGPAIEPRRVIGFRASQVMKARIDAALGD